LTVEEQNGVVIAIPAMTDFAKTFSLLPVAAIFLLARLRPVNQSGRAT